VVPCFKTYTLSSRSRLIIVCGFALAWLGFFAWHIAWPLTWVSIPVLASYGYVVFRLLFELTFNRAHIPTLATCLVARRKIASILRHEAELRSRETYNVVDLGAGRGELARCIAKQVPCSKVIGIELARFPFMQAAFVQRWFGPKNLSYERRDFWHYDCSQVDAVVLFLTPMNAQRMGEKLQREMKAGGMVVSHTYPLLGLWCPEDVLNFRSPFKETVYVYRK